MITMNQTYAKIFQCKYQLVFFPFDTQVNCYLIVCIINSNNVQVCTTGMVVSELEKESVRLVPGSVTILGEKELTEYFITDEPKSPTLIYQKIGLKH